MKLACAAEPTNESMVSRGSTGRILFKLGTKEDPRKLASRERTRGDARKAAFSAPRSHALGRGVAWTTEAISAGTTNGIV